MSLGEIIEERRNYIIVRDLLGGSVLYDRTENRFHDAGKTLDAVLEARIPGAGAAYLRMPRAIQRAAGFFANAAFGLTGIESVIERLRDDEARVPFAVDEATMESWLGQPFPHITFELTRGCNFGPCGYCNVLGRNYEGRDFRPGTMSEETAMAALSMFRPKTTQSPFISFFGGEPGLAFPMMKKIVAASREMFDSPQYTVTTNMSIGGEYLDFLLENDFKVMVSLDGPKHIHDRNRFYRAGGGTFDTVMENLDYFISHSEDPARNLTFNVVISNPAEISEIRSFFSERFPQIPVTVSYVTQKGLTNPGLRFREEDVASYDLQRRAMAIEYIEAIRSGAEPDRFLEGMFAKSLMSMFDVGYGAEGKTMLPNGICAPGRKHLFVTVEGDYFPCNNVPYGLPVGSVASGFDDDSVRKGIQSMAGYRNGLCLDCYAQRVCLPCFKQVMVAGHMDPAGLEESCSASKSALVDALSLFSAVNRTVPPAMIKNYLNNMRIDEVC